MTPKQRKNVYVQPDGQEPQKFKAGFGYLLAECKRLGAKEGWIICPQKGTLTGGHIEAALGKEAAKALHDGKTVVFNGVQIVPGYATRMPNIGNGSPVLAAYLSAKSLSAVDDLYEVPSLIVVPFAVELKNDADTKSWREKWTPDVIAAAASV